MRALKYDVTVNCVKGPDVPIVDALSRVSPQLAPSNGELPEICVHHITHNPPASPTKLQQIRDETGKDPALSLLNEVVFGGWLQKREEYPQSLHDYWNSREELTIEDGLKGDRIVIPPTLRPEAEHHTPRPSRAGEMPFASTYICLLAWNYKGNHQPS